MLVMRAAGIGDEGGLRVVKFGRFVRNFSSSGSKRGREKETGQRRSGSQEGKNSWNAIQDSRM